jgi:hypothetical protein
MAIIPKDAVLQIRLPSDLAARYRDLCEERMTPASARVRQFILREVEDWERLKARSASQALQQAREPLAEPSPPPRPSTVAPAVRNAAEEGLSRKERRELERKRRKGLIDDDE